MFCPSIEVTNTLVKRVNLAVTDTKIKNLKGKDPTTLRIMALNVTRLSNDIQYDSTQHNNKMSC